MTLLDVQLIQDLLLTQRVLPKLNQSLHAVLFSNVFSDVFALLSFEFVDEKFDEAIIVSLGHGVLDGGLWRLLGVRSAVGSGIVLLFDLVLVLSRVFGALHADSLLVALSIILLWGFTA